MAAENAENTEDTGSAANAASALDDLLPRLFREPGGLRSAALTAPLRRPDPDDEAAVRRVDVAPVSLKGGPHFQFAYRDRRKVTHRNLPPAEAEAHARELLADAFGQALFRGADADYHLSRGKNGRWSVRRRPATAAAAPDAAPAEHNRRKNYLLPDAGVPIPFLVRLGVMTADGQVVAAKYDKFRQINRFLEMVADVRDALPSDRPLRVVDFGSGKSYLTFALYHYLRVGQGLDVTVVGLDLRRDLVAHCARIAADLGWDDRLRFEAGDIAGYAGAAAAADGAGVDMVVSLHACDTATDDALAKAVAWDASVILAVPCCQHELFRQIESPEMRPLLKHGILKERLAALVTDALRAETLERRGYQVQVLEFIDLEHTPKNLLLRAVRRRHADPAYQQRIEQEYRTFRDFWHARPHIERALGETAEQSPTSAGSATDRPGSAP